MSSIEEVLVPMYLLHRYQIEAAAKEENLELIKSYFESLDKFLKSKI